MCAQSQDAAAQSVVAPWYCSAISLWYDTSLELPLRVRRRPYFLSRRTTDMLEWIEGQ